MLSLVRSRGKHVLGIFSPLPQLEYKFSADMRSLKLPVLCMPPQRMNAIPALLKELPIKTFVLTEEDVPQLSSILQKTTTVDEGTLLIIVTPTP